MVLEADDEVRESQPRAMEPARAERERGGEVAAAGGGLFVLGGDRGMKRSDGIGFDMLGLFELVEDCERLCVGIILECDLLRRSKDKSRVAIVVVEVEEGGDSQRSE